MKRSVLQDVVSLPTAPFHEDAVIDYVKETCKKLGIPVKADRSLNLVAHYKYGKAKQGVVLTTHMDHPGFEVLSSAGTEKCVVGMLGGIKPEYFTGARVLIKTAGGIAKGVVSKKALGKKWHGKPCFEVRVSKKVRAGDFGWYNLVPFRLKNNIIYTKSADNLVSTAALLDLLKTLVRKKVKADVRFLFTRAEEVGFVGCISFAGENLLPKNIPIVVLECSSASAGKVQIGGGPVIRVGDKLSSFSPEVGSWLKSTAEAIAATDKRFKFQRALLGGGTCEATVWILKGAWAGGLAFPLGNYHNNGERSYAPEFVSKLDYDLMQIFLLRLVCADRVLDTFKRSGKNIARNYPKWKRRLTTKR